MKRRGVGVFARSGYVAVPALGAIPVLRFEANALSALAANPRPTQIAMRAATFEFPEAAGTQPRRAVRRRAGQRRRLLRRRQQHGLPDALHHPGAHPDDAGDPVRKGSQPYRLKGAAEDVHVARQGDILFYRQPTLEPGRYTVEYALYDELSGQAGTGTLPLEVAARDPQALAMSSLVLVERAEAVPEDQRDPANPLYFGTTLVYPNLGTPVARSRRGSLVFYYTARAAGRPLRGRVELLQESRVVASREMAVPSADDAGRIQHANELPLDGVGAGPYELRVTLSDGRSSVVRSTAFTLQP